MSAGPPVAVQVCALCERPRQEGCSLVAWAPFGGLALGRELGGAPCPDRCCQYGVGSCMLRKGHNRGLPTCVCVFCAQAEEAPVKRLHLHLPASGGGATEREHTEREHRHREHTEKSSGKGRRFAMALVERQQLARITRALVVQVTQFSITIRD